MSAPVDRLLNDDRFAGDNVWHFLLYLPLGLGLMGLRVLAGLVLWVASMVLPNKSSMRHLVSSMACITFGITVEKKGTRDPKSSLLIANYVSALDPLAVSWAFGTISLRKWKVPPFFASALGIRHTSHFVAKQHLSDIRSRPVLLQPEGVATNGRGLLAFRDWPVSLCNRVQPVTIRCVRALTSITVHSCLDTADKFPWSDVLWYLWSPYTKYTVHALPPVERFEGESDRQFADKIRRSIAEALEVEATEYGVEDVIECARRGVRRTPRGANTNRADLNRLAQQVKEVLPLVPTTDILRDLARTRSVDVTITNFLEEITPYTPEEPQQPSTSVPPSRPASQTPGPSAVFPRSAKDRQLSFKERKAEMIAVARRRYIEKHGLDC